MRIALISDVHANLPALEAVVADAKAAYANTFLCAGDVVGFGPHPKECVDTVRGLCQLVVSGNHERAIGWSEDCQCNPAFAGIATAAEAYAREELFAQDIQWLAGLGHEAGLYLSGKELYIVHGSPWDPLFTGIPPNVDPGRLRKAFFAIDCDYAILGHTHQQMVLTDVLENVTVINPGTVGFPIDGDPRAAYVLMDPEKGEVYPRRVPYDAERVIKDLRYLKAGDGKVMENIYRFGTPP